MEFDRKWRESFSGTLKDPIRRISAERHAWWMDHGLLRSLYDNEFEISKGIYRSNQPSPKKIEYWFKKGVRTILNLRGESDQGAYYLEKEACKTLEQNKFIKIDKDILSLTKKGFPLLNSINDKIIL